MTSRKSVVLAWVIAASAAVSLSACGGNTQPPRQPPVSLNGERVMEFNFCGNICNKDSTSGPVDDLVRTLDTFHPRVVFLEEMCQRQVTAIETKSAAAGNWRVYGAMDVDLPGGCAHGGDDFGDAILSHAPINASTEAEANLGGNQPAGTEQRKVLCLISDSLLVPTRVCVTHIGLSQYIGAGLQATEVSQATRFALHNYAGPVILAGDFNSTPDDADLDATYADGGNSSGSFTEIDACPGPSGRARTGPACNIPTHPKDSRKIDYIFLRAGDFSQSAARVTHAVASDHNLLEGSVEEHR